MPPELDDSLEGIDYSALSSEIGSDLGFGNRASPAAPDAAPQVGATPNAAPAAPATPNAAPITPEAWESLPKAWKKEMEAHWKTMNPEARRYVHDREKQALDGIMHYKGHYDKWEQAYAPVKEYYSKTQIDPLQAFQRLSQADMALRHAPDDQKIQFLETLIRDYGLLPLLQARQGQRQGQPNGQPAVQQPVQDPRINQLLEEVNSIKGSFQQQQLAEYEKQVHAFVADPANEYAGEVLADMLTLMNSGQAQDLRTAYDSAIWLNAGVRQKMLDKQMAAISTPPGRGPKIVHSSNTPPAPTGKKASSVDETMEDTYAAIMSRA